MDSVQRKSRCDRLGRDADALFAAKDYDGFYLAVRTLAIVRLRCWYDDDLQKQRFIRAQCEDIAQEVVICVLQNVGGFDPRQPISHWINTIISNVAASAGRKYRSDLRSPSSLVLVSDNGMESHDDALARLIYEWELKFERDVTPEDRVWQLLPTIKDPFIAAVAQLLAAGYNRKKIAAAMKITLDTLNGRVKRYSQKHRSALDEPTPDRATGTGKKFAA